MSSDSSSSSKSSSKYKHKTAKILEKAYETASNIAKENSGKNRGIAAGTAAAFLSIGLDKINGNDELQYTDEEFEAIKEFAESSTEENQTHFMDKFLERVVRHTMNDGTVETEVLEQRINDRDRNRRPGLSIRILISNFKKLSSKMTGFFAIQYGLIHVITWKKPTKTLCCLFVYTSICFWPHLVLAYPLLALLFGVMIPGYVYSHPMGNPELIKVRKRGQSIWDFLSDSESSSIVDDLLGDDFLELLEEKENFLGPISSRSSDSGFLISSASATLMSTSSSINLDTPEQVQQHQERKEHSKKVKKQMNLLLNMRDLQNLTTDLLKGMDKAEDLFYDTAGFKDEKISTLIVYGLFITTVIIIGLGQFIPWRLIFIQTGWAGILLCHPNSKKYIKAIKPKKSTQPKEPKEPVESEPVDEKAPETDKKPNSALQFVIVDDAPQIRYVEIFELQYKTPTSTGFSFYNYSTRMFDIKDHIRLSGKRPVGVDQLSKVSPPQDWDFEMSFANTWKIDGNPQVFLEERGLLNPEVFVLKDVEEGWIYDNTKGIPDLDYVFRRRRLYRHCLRYRRKPRKA